MSLTGLDDGDFTNINVMYSIGLGATADTGTSGQVIKSDGLNASWGDDESTGYTAGAGIDITGTTIKTDNDNTTINNSGASDTNQVLKVPNALTRGTNITFSSGTTYDGSGAITISSTDTNTTYSAGAGIALSLDTFSADTDDTTINTSGVSDTIQVLKVPNALTAGTNISFSSGTTYDGSSAITINSDDTTLPNLLYPTAQGTTGDSNRTIAILNHDTGGALSAWNGSVPARLKLNLLSGDTTQIHSSASTGVKYEVKKVPNAHTAGSGLSGSTFDGADARTWSVVSPYTQVSTNVYQVPVNVGMAVGSTATVKVVADGGTKEGWINWDSGSLSFCVDVPSGYTITSYFISLYDGSGIITAISYFAVRDRIVPTSWVGYSASPTGTNTEITVSGLNPAGITNGHTQYCVIEIPHNESPSGGEHYSGGGWIKITKT